jgi:hypothetical protein
MGEIDIWAEETSSSGPMTPKSERGYRTIARLPGPNLSVGMPGDGAISPLRD